MALKSNSDDASRALAESARYALIRRLAPLLRHEAVAPLQPIAMTAGALERRLRDPSPPLTQVRETAARLAGYARAGIESCLNLLEWVAPAAPAGVSLQQAVHDTLALLQGSLALRGVTLHDQVPGDLECPDGARLRYLLPACLLWLIDSAGSPAEVTLCAHAAGDRLQLVLDLQPSEGVPGLEDAPAYRPLREEQVRALARDEGVELTREGDTLTLSLTRIHPTTDGERRHEANSPS
jgi:hypothetical protein